MRPRARVSQKSLRFTESVIREMARLCHQHDGINLSQGFPDFPAPQAIKEAACAAINADVNQFPRDVIELMDYLKPPEPARVRAIPGDGLDIPIWILGSSLFGAQLAAQLGLPYAFASPFAPGPKSPDLPPSPLSTHRAALRPTGLDLCLVSRELSQARSPPRHRFPQPV